MTPVPIICMEGVGIEDVVKYYESYCLHNDAQMDWLAEQADIYSHIKVLMLLQTSKRTG